IRETTRACSAPRRVGIRAMCFVIRCPSERTRGRPSMLARLYCFVLLSALAMGCGGGGESASNQPRKESAAPASKEVAMSFHLTSSAFADSGDIPKSHTCDGGDVSPPL